MSVDKREYVLRTEEIKKQAAELAIANKELIYQNEEKEKRAAELAIANKELIYQNEEREKRAAELAIANKELVFQNEEKIKRAAELLMVNKEFLAFSYLSSHDLQEPLRKITTFAGLILTKESRNLSTEGQDYCVRLISAAQRMQQQIQDLLIYSRINSTEQKNEKTDIRLIIKQVENEFIEIIEAKHAIIEIINPCEVNVIPFQFRQLMHNLIDNALKFSIPGVAPHIVIKSRIVSGRDINNNFSLPEKEYCQVSVTDNGIGFEPEYRERIFDIFEKLHSNEDYEGTGIGLAIVKKIVENHNGVIVATSALNEGTTFDIYLPVEV